MSGEEFRRLRNKLELNQVELGKLMDVSERGIRRWENDEVEIPTIAELALRYLAQNYRKRGRL